MSEWFDLEESGDIVGIRNWPDGPRLPQREVLQRVAGAFRRVAIDWTEGDRWVEARIIAATESGYSGLLLEAEHALRGRTVLVSVADAPGPDAAWVRSYVPPDMEFFELRYDPPGALEACRALALKLAEAIGYEFQADEDDKPVNPDFAPDRGGPR
jgi:hypothetical protein